MTENVSFRHRSYLRAIRILLLIGIVSLTIPFASYGQARDTIFVSEADSIFRRGSLDSSLKTIDPILSAEKGSRNRANVRIIQGQPFNSLQQMIKGQVAGLYVQEPSGEPGTNQYMYVRGMSRPLLSKQDVFAEQPVVFLNGIPLIQESGMEFGIQKSELNPIGPATNIFSIIDPATIEHIEVLKDPSVLAKLGPIAANGAIWVVTKNARSGKKEITIDTYFGAVQNKKITPVNAFYENSFRQPFYNKYATANDIINYPAYLRDSTDLAYYGPADWTDLYFKNALVYGISPSLTVGTERANFRFSLNNERSASGQDGARLDRYGFSFFVNMLPIDWLTISSMIGGNRLERQRNQNFRDRLTEMRYVPDMSNPLPPGKNLYASYLGQFDESIVIDDNKVTSLQGYFSMNAKPLARLSFTSRLSVDYNERLRDVFWPTTLLEGNNFVSNYFGYNQRFMISNTAEYFYPLGTNHNLSLEAGQQYQSDVYKYDYGFGYNTPNDFIKIRTVNMNGAAFSMPYFPIVEKMNHHLASFYGQVGYTYKETLKLTGVVRRDGSSFVQPNYRWITTPMVNVEWDGRSLLSNTESLSSLALRASYGRLGSPFNTDRYSVGPNYVVDVAWPAEPHIGSYVGIGASSRPYTRGWVGYGISWQYADKINAGVDLGFFKNRLNLSVDVYSNNNKNMVLPMPVPKEYGYTVAYEAGMEMNNKGVDVTIAGDILRNPGKANWTSTLNFNYNKNKLTALPRGLQQIVIGQTLLEVGQPADAFWIYQNAGIYNSVSDIPVNSQTGLRMSFRGREFNPGDARWADINGDYDINDEDKVLTGNFMPKLTGGWSNNINYNRFTLDFLFYFATGHKILNTHIANRLNFINGDGAVSPDLAKEITFWQKTFNPENYPMYNPWSDVVPYREDQDLFLQDASFVKLRSASLGYDLISNNGLFKKGVFNKCLLYVSGTNLFTISKIKDFDPELADYNGRYTGYNQYIPRLYTIGVKLSF